MNTHHLDGYCQLTRIAAIHSEPLYGLRVDHADSHILITAELVDEIRAAIRAGTAAPGVTLNGDVLRIEGVNRTVVYRIGEYDRELHAYHASRATAVEENNSSSSAS